MNILNTGVSMMRKRVLSSILALCMILTLLPVQALAAETGLPLTDQYFSEALLWSLDEEGTLTIKKNLNTENKNYSMPNYDAASVKPWKQYLPQIISVVVEDGITNVGSYVFRNCTNLTNVSLPSSVTEIGKDSFASCTSLENVTIPNGVTSIQSNAFSYCSNLTSVTFPESLKEIGDSAFRGTNLSELSLPSQLQTIGKLAFSSKTLTEITIPASVTNISGGAFSECQKLRNIIVSEGNTCYHFDSPCLFAIDGAKKPVTLSVCLPVIHTRTYTVPETVTCIDNCAFLGCNYLNTLNLPPNLQTIGSEAFQNCVSLHQLDIPDTVTSIGSSAFTFCDFDIVIPGGVKEIGPNFFSASEAKNITLSEGITKIGNNSLTGC